MAKATNRRKAILQALDRTNRPIYLLDANRRFVYGNPALEAWLGVMEGDLLGEQIDFAAEPARRQQPWSGLCPPLSAWHSGSASTLVWKTNAEGKVQRFRARVITLAGTDEDETSALVVIEGRESDASPGVAQDVTKDPQRLHNQLVERRNTETEPLRIVPLIGNSPAIERTRAQAHLASQHPDRVLIQGAEGTGHEEVARAIHRASRRSLPSRLFPIECSLLDADLFDTTIEALVRRSTDSADEPVATLLLLDVDRLAEDAQYALLRLLQGSPQEFRTLATSRRELSTFTPFRGDLATRLNALTVQLPALGERLEDLPLLIQGLVEQANLGASRQVDGLTPEAIDRLVNHPWAGNLDELAETIRSAHAQCRTPRIGCSDLPNQIQLSADAERYPAAPLETIDLDQYLLGIESELIRRALRQAGGNRAQAARLLGVSRSRLLRRLATLQIDAADE